MCVRGRTEALGVRKKPSFYRHSLYTNPGNFPTSFAYTKPGNFPTLSVSMAGESRGGTALFSAFRGMAGEVPNTSHFAC